MEEKLREALDLVSFSSAVARISSGLYSFGPHVVARVMLTGDDVVASQDDGPYEPIAEFIRRLAQAQAQPAQSLAAPVRSSSEEPRQGGPVSWRSSSEEPRRQGGSLSWAGSTHVIPSGPAPVPETPPIGAARTSPFTSRPQSPRAQPPQLQGPGGMQQFVVPGTGVVPPMAPTLAGVASFRTLSPQKGEPGSDSVAVQPRLPGMIAQAHTPSTPERLRPAARPITPVSFQGQRISAHSASSGQAPLAQPAVPGPARVGPAGRGIGTVSRLRAHAPCSVMGGAGGRSG